MLIRDEPMACSECQFSWTHHIGEFEKGWSKRNAHCSMFKQEKECELKYTIGHTINDYTYLKKRRSVNEKGVIYFKPITATG